MARTLFAIPEIQVPKGDVEGENSNTILHFLKKKSLDSVVLFSLPGYGIQTKLTEQAIEQQMPKCRVTTYPLSFTSFSYKEIFRELKNVFSHLPSWQEKDAVTILLPLTMQNTVIDSLLLFALSLPMPVTICQSGEKELPEAAIASASLFELHDSAGEKAPLTPLSTQQLDFLYRTWSQGDSFCLKTKDQNQQQAAANALQAFEQSQDFSFHSIFCDELPQEYSNSLLWGYSAKINRKIVTREGLLTKEKQSLSFLHWDAFSEDLKSTTVAFLCRMKRHFVALSTQSDALLQIPTYVLP